MDTRNDIFNPLEFGYCFYDVECLLGALDMKVGDLIEYTVIGGEEKALGIVLKDLGYNIQYGCEAVSVYWFDSELRTTERKHLLPENYEVISEGR